MVAADWDLPGARAGRYGSGLAGLLELARVLMHDPSFTPKHSVIFVAFDQAGSEVEIDIILEGKDSIQFPA